MNPDDPIAVVPEPTLAPELLHQIYKNAYEFVIENFVNPTLEDHMVIQNAMLKAANIALASRMTRTL